LAEQFFVSDLEFVTELSSCGIAETESLSCLHLQPRRSTSVSKSGPWREFHCVSQRPLRLYHGRHLTRFLAFRGQPATRRLEFYCCRTDGTWLAFNGARRGALWSSGH